MQSTSKEPVSEIQPSLDNLSDTREKCMAYFLGDDQIPPHLLIRFLKQDVQLILVSALDTDLLNADLIATVNQAQKIQRALENQMLKIKQRHAASSSSHQPLAMDEGELPVREIPSFDGNLSEYSSYRSILLTKVIENPEMPVTAKWCAFLNSLSGYPAYLVSRYPQTEADLIPALGCLDSAFQERIFEGADKMVAGLRRRLSELPAGWGTESCLTTHAQLEGILILLAQIGHPIDTDDDIRSEYCQKFPPELISAIGDDDGMPFKEMRDAIGNAIREAQEKDKEERRRVALSEQPTHSVT